MRQRIVAAAGALVAAALIALVPGARIDGQPAPGRPAPEITAGKWINSPPLTIGSLRGRVVAVEFWTFG